MQCVHDWVATRVADMFARKGSTGVTRALSAMVAVGQLTVDEAADLYARVGVTPPGGG